MKRIGSIILSFLIIVQLYPFIGIKAYAANEGIIKTDLAQWNAIDGDQGGNVITCDDIYLITLEDEDADIILDVTDEYGNIAYFTNNNFDGFLDIDALKTGVSFSDLYNDVADDGTGCFAITGTAAKDGVSLSTVFGDVLPSGLSEDDAVIFICGIDDDGCWDNHYAEVGYIVCVKAAGGNNQDEIDKADLQELIACVTGLNVDNWYQEGDRYNGKSYILNGSFWNSLQSILITAQSILDNTNATQIQIKDAYDSLNDAIINLIPKSQINATELYEATLETYYWLDDEVRPASSFTGIVNLDEVNENTCTPESWTVYMSALSAANEELGKLFNNGVATEYNSSSGEAVENVAAVLSALNAAVEGFDKYASQQDIEKAEFAYKELLILYRRVMNPSALNEAVYTPESWSAFKAAADDAAAFLAAHTTPTASIGRKEAVAYQDAAKAFWSAAYEGLSGTNAGTATIQIVDSYSQRTGGTPASIVGTYIVNVPAGGISIHEALQEKLGSDYALPFNETGLGYGVYLNGIYLHDVSIIHSRPDTSSAYRDVRLKDGDTVLIALMEMPTFANLSGSIAFSIYTEVHDAIRYVSIVKDGAIVSEIESVAGDELALSANYYASSLMDYNGASVALKEAKVFVSEACMSREDALAATPLMDTGTITSNDGTFSITLYSASGKTDGWYALSLLASDENGGLTNGTNLIIHVTDPEDISSLKAELKAELEQVYMAYEDSFYSADQLEKIYDLYYEGIAKIDAAANSGTANEAFRAAYDAIKAIQEENEKALELNLAAVRDLLNYLPNAEDLATGRLYNVDKNVLDLLFGEDGWYTRMTQYQRSMLLGAESTHISNLETAYLNSNYGNDLEAPPVITITAEVRDASTNEVLDLPLSFDGYCFYINVKQFEESYGGFSYTGSMGECIYDENAASLTLPTDGFYRVDLNFSVGFDSAEYSYADSSYATSIDEHYRVSKLEGENLTEFYMPRQNAVVTIYLTPVDQLATQKDAAIKELQNKYQSYYRTDYTDDGWTELTNAYYEGISKIREADSAEKVNEEKNKALNAMAAVDTRPDGNYGSVTVTVQNVTFTVADGALWDGALVNNKTVELKSDSTMMSCIVEALAGYTVIGAETNYISSINGVAEFDGGRQSGWMGTLNDWFVNEGFSQFGVQNDKLHDGDVICVEYTCAFGADIRGGTEGNNDTTLYDLSLTGGTLTPTFSGDVTEYVFMLNEGVSKTTINFTNNNRAFQSRAYLNSYAPSANNWIRSGDSVMVISGDVITVGVGESVWPSMGSGTPTKYKITIVSPDDSEAVEALIDAIGNVVYSNYEEKAAAVAAAKEAYDALTDEAKADVSNASVLEAAVKAVADYKQVDEIKDAIAALPSAMDQASEAELQAVVDGYDALTPEQQDLLTKAEKAKVERAREALAGNVTPETPDELLAKDKAAIEADDVDWTVDQETANDTDALKTFVEGKLAKLELNGTPSVTITKVTPAIAGTAEAESGVNGSYNFTVELVLDGATPLSASIENAVITAKVYEIPYVPTEYEDILKADQAYLKKEITNPIVGSVGGEWAVFALNRGGVAEEDWNNLYLSNLQDYVDECEGRLHNRKYTEYSRVVLALTSMGVDATKFKTEKGTYDLVSPLLEKQSNGEYWAEWQGNNGTAFALLALDSHNYLDNEEGNAARAAFIASLKNKQLDNGGWYISSGNADIDTTAAAIYALAPYYLDSSKLDALGGSVSHDELKAMVDNALSYLSSIQNAKGGYGSVEADDWVLIALASLDRDADKDPMFVKNGYSLLSDIVTYHDKTTGGFRHVADGSVDGMASEQTAYALAAYDRYKKNQNTLYDMTDVEFKDIDQETIDEAQQEYDQAQADAVKEKIDAIGEVTLESEADIKAARKAYDALTDDQKALVTNYEDLVAAEEKLEELKAAATQEEIDEAAASAVDKKIDAIGDADAVTLDSEEAIKAAREAYNNLTADQKKLVKNLAALEAAEKRLEDLKKAAADGTITKAVDKNGKDIAYTLEDVDEKHILTKEKAAEVNDKIDSPDQVEILWQKDIVVPDGTEFPATLTFAVQKAYRDNDVFVYHYNGTDWEVVAEGKGSEIAAEFDSLSPGALVAKTGDAAKTGDSNNMFLWAGVCVVALAAAAVTVIAGKKRREE